MPGRQPVGGSNAVIDQAANRGLMTRMYLALLPLTLLAAQPAAASSGFNGTWLMDLASIEQPPEISTISLRGGVFSRAAHGPGFAVKADGRVHRLSSDGYVDAVAVTALGPRRVREIDRLHGKIIYVVTYSVSADGRTMTERVVDFGRPDHKPIPTTSRWVRIGRAEPGSPLSGRWQATGATTTRGHLTHIFRLVGNRFSTIGPGGSGYDAIIGGPPVPDKGDTATAQAAVTMPDDHTIVERGFVDGAQTITKTMTLLPDGRSIRVEMQRLSDSAVIVWMLRRQ
ncbi:MAG: hypothetical protein JWM65_984 [Sphingomonas bacterium]|nr:hypothetical protein [Sphingomonas bacterium]